MKTTQKIKERLSQFWKTARLTGNLMAGVPDYANYLAQQQKQNPNSPVMSEQEFMDYCRKRRCNANGGRCC